MTGNPEKERLDQANTGGQPWKKWGPYLSERQWGTVREDYSKGGNAWEYFKHDQARSRAYRWGEDGIAGISDDKQRLCFAVALWNGEDPILKERLFGLTNSEGNHGEDVKEYYFYLDNTPTHSYMKCLYKYPQRAFPYSDLVEENRRRNRDELEYELLDTRIFEEDRYFDVFIEYAKETPEDLLIKITAWNRGPQEAQLHLLPTLWFRNTWSQSENSDRPLLRMMNSQTNNVHAVRASHRDLGDRYLYCEPGGSLLFTENETNRERIYGTTNFTPHVKDGFNEYVIHARTDRVNPAALGTKMAAYYKLTIAPGQYESVRLRLCQVEQSNVSFGKDFDEAMNARRLDADEYYSSITPSSFSADEAGVFRQALAGMLWSKQFYYYDVNQWLKEHNASPFQAGHHGNRNGRWHHMYNADIISMPDKWEYPWYAAWDLAFHVIALTLVDEEFGKNQLELILSTDYVHPNGQIPAYEWNFSDVNPPVQAWSAIFAYRLGQRVHEQGDLDWLERVFHKLLLNFNWWVNRKDRLGNNVFEGGFLGLDNIGVFDRSSPLPTGGYLDQADGTAWMALFCQNMLEIAEELANSRPVYSEMYVKFFEHFLLIAASMIHAGGDVGMWDEADGFFYDVLRLPGGDSFRLRVRSMVGLLPLCAVTVFDRHLIDRFPNAAIRLRKFAEDRPELTAFIHDPRTIGPTGRFLCSVLNETNLRRVLSIMLDENEFFSPYGIRSLSRRHADNPYVLSTCGREYSVAYRPAESNDNTFGGNSNWRGPIWMPVNIMIIRSLIQYYAYYANSFTVECPTGSGRKMNLFQVAKEISYRLERIFLRHEDGYRPVFGGNQKFQNDPLWRNYLLFYEYFHGDNGAGIGASHQTGWSGVIARAMHLFAVAEPEDILALGKKAASFAR